MAANHFWLGRHLCSIPAGQIANFFSRGSLSANERKDYTNAVLCLQAKQANTPSSLIPGAKSRFDDFVGLHINDTNFIHYTVSKTLAPPVATCRLD